MYTQLQQTTNIKDVWIVQFSVLKQNENIRKRVHKIFNEEVTEDDFIVYSTSEDGCIILGRILFDEENMINSPMYETLRINTMQDNEDPTEEISNTKCIQIKEWVFDITLRNKKCLLSIFQSICLMHNHYNEATILWTNGNNGLLFYNIYNDKLAYARPSAISYFADAFLNE